MTPTPAELTCTHRLASRPRPAIVGLLKPSIEVYCTQGCGFSAVGPDHPMAWLTAGAKIAGDRSAIEIQQMRILLGQLVVLARGDTAPEEDRLSGDEAALVLQVADTLLQPGTAH